MNDAGLTPLSRPTGSQLRVAQSMQEPLSDGFNFPDFRLARKKNRVVICPEELSIPPPHSYKLFATASSKGWFVAATNNSIICSPLKDLQDALESDDETKPTFSPKRTVALPAQPIILAFSPSESRLVLGLLDGSICFFATAQLFSASGDVSPVQVLSHSSSPPRQIVANPSSDADLQDMFAIVRADGNVEIVDNGFQLQGGWTARELDAVVVAAAWSPKGKQIALGLRLGDIVAFAPSQKAHVQKHVPPTCSITGQLSSLTWLPGPGYNFRTSYVPADLDSDVSTHHGVHVDNKASTVQVTELTHPYRLPGRPTQTAYISILTRWDQDAISTEPPSARVVLIAGDMSSSDIEVFGRTEDQWYYHYQDNQMTVPLNEESEDTTLLSLDVDLCNSTGNPILYAYLNDGSVQAWYAHHSKPYAGMVKSEGIVSNSTTQPQPSGTSAFGQPSGTPSPFAQASEPAKSPFGQPSAFGQPQTTSPFSQPQQTSTFGQPSTLGGGSSPFGGGTSGFGTGFGSGASQSAFGGGQQSAFGGGQGNAQQQSAFGGGAQQSAFGSSSSAFGSGAASASIQEDSMAEDGPSFGGMSLGGGDTSASQKPAGGIFGAPAPPPDQSTTTTNPSPFGSGVTIKPPSGFGAFGGVGSLENSPFAPKASTPSTSAFATGFSNSSAPPQTSAFGATGGVSAFGQPSFGQTSKPVFGQPAFAQKPPIPATTTPSAGGGFSNFASGGPSSFAAAAATTATKSTGFGGFASGGPSAFGAATEQVKPAVSEPTKATGFGAFASTGPSAFGAKPADSQPTATSKATGFGSFASGGPSAFGAPAKPAEEPKTSASESAKPTGFGSFASAGPSPFGPQPPSDKTSSVFGSASPPATAFEGNISPNAQPSAFASKDSPAQTSSPFASGPVLPDSPFGKGPFGSPSNAPEPTKSAFQQTSTPQSSPFGGGSGFAGLANSPFGKGAFAPSSSPSPEPSGSPTTSSPTSPSPFMTPSKSNTPANNAFSNIRVTAFQPSEGFGAFGGGAKNESSPFFKSSETKTAPQVSAFANLTTASSSSSPPTATPTFGAPTSISTRSPFGLPTTTPAATPTKPSTGGFGAYANTTSVFGKAAEGKTSSFQDLLSGKKGDDPVKRASSPPKASEDGKATAPSTPPPPETVRESKDKGKAKESDDVEPQSKESGSMSSVASSYVDVSHEDGFDGELREEDDDDEDARSFLSQSVSSGDEEYDEDEETEEREDHDEHEEEEEEETDEDEDAKSPTPTQVPLPPSRSASSTPQPAEAFLPTIVEETTTPPGSPEKKPSPPAAATPLPSIGLGRPPNTRPTRSSPLANAVSESEDDTEEEKAQPVPKPRPASPKTPFGILPVKTEPDSSTPTSRPKTPPLLSSFVGSGGLFGKPPAPLNPNTPTFTPPSSFSLPKAGSPASPSPFAPQVSPSPPEKPAAQGMMPPPKMPTFNPPPTTLPGGSLFGKMPPPPTPPVPAAVPLTAPKQAPPPQSAHVPQRHTFNQDLYEEGMQRECAKMFALMVQELEILRALAAKASSQREAYMNRAGGSSNKADLGDPTKWAPADSQKFKETLLTFSEDLEVIRENTDAAQLSVKELGSGLVRANTRREEIDRFSRAKEDEDFKKMLKARSLGPELLEAKARLRGELMRKKKEISRLEDTLAENKKRMTAMKSHKGVFKSPSLDTVNRTYRNIDLAIRQEQAALESLTKRMAAVNFSSTKSRSPSVGPSSRDSRLPDVKALPHVAPYAVTTAAALNAERSAQKLKNALFAVRQEPLLNQPKALKKSPPVAFLSSSQVQAHASPTGNRALGATGLNFNTPIKIQGSLFADSSSSSAPAGAFDFDDDGDNFHLQEYTPTVKSRKSKKHGGGLFKGATPPAPPSFNWGPLPSFQHDSKQSSAGPFVSISGGRS